MSSLKKEQSSKGLSDKDKLHSNWEDALILYQQENWSASIVRLATATEISANIYIKKYLINKFKLPKIFVDSLLKSANGIDGKFKRLITPIVKKKKKKGWNNNTQNLQTKIASVNSLRNEIVHVGSFADEGNANDVFKTALEVVKALSPIAAEKLDVPKK